MQKKMKYSLYKTGYDVFPAHDYDAARKTIIVELPDYKKPNFPKSWEKWGNHYSIPGSGDYIAMVTFWNTGPAENFVVEHWNGRIRIEKTIPAGLYARQNVIDYVNSLIS